MMDRLKTFIATWWKFALALVFVAGASYFLGQCDGRKSERNAWQAKAARFEKEAADRARKADEARRQELATQTGNIAKDREELDNATRDLPDESPSARRRARVCRELRETARRSGSPPPAC